MTLGNTKLLHYSASGLQPWLTLCHCLGRWVGADWTWIQSWQALNIFTIFFHVTVSPPPPVKISENEFNFIVIFETGEYSVDFRFFLCIYTNFQTWHLPRWSLYVCYKLSSSSIVQLLKEADHRAKNASNACASAMLDVNCMKNLYCTLKVLCNSFKIPSQAVYYCPRGCWHSLPWTVLKPRPLRNEIEMFSVNSN